MSTTPEHFPTETEGLPEARPSELVELADGDEFDLRIAPVAKQLGDDDCADAGLQRLDPRADPEGAGGLRDRRQRREPGRHGGDRPLARPAAREPLRRHPRDPGARSRSASASRPGSRSRTRASTGTTRTSARTTARRWGSTATSSSSPPTPTTGRPANREAAPDARRHPARGRQGRAVQPRRDDALGDGPLRRRAAGERRDGSLADGAGSARSCASTSPTPPTPACSRSRCRARG